MPRHPEDDAFQPPISFTDVLAFMVMVLLADPDRSRALPLPRLEPEAAAGAAEGTSLQLVVHRSGELTLQGRPIGLAELPQHIAEIAGPEQALSIAPETDAAGAGNLQKLLEVVAALQQASLPNPLRLLATSGPPVGGGGVP